MEIYTKPGAIPLVVHNPVPLHWRAAVKAGKDSDVARECWRRFHLVLQIRGVLGWLIICNMSGFI